MPKPTKLENYDISQNVEGQMKEMSKRTKADLLFIKNYKRPSKKFLKKWRKDMEDFFKKLKRC
ncbi:unnamed protein product [marine sediment metagenome]|uniref:Uncharacterized protein n=1 Tax=marine sediment metagenome TaxID=412755 RepID=X1P779_9ZZZZ